MNTSRAVVQIFVVFSPFVSFYTFGWKSLGGRGMLQYGEQHVSVVPLYFVYVSKSHLASDELSNSLMINIEWRTSEWMKSQLAFIPWQEAQMECTLWYIYISSAPSQKLYQFSQPKLKKKEHKHFFFLS